MYGYNRRAKLVACWHESGHAVAAAACGGSVTSIEVRDSGGGITYVVMPPGLLEKLTIIYGGEVARAYGAFIDAGSSTEPDGKRLQELTAHLTPEKRAAVLAAAEARAVEIVTKNYAALGHLAEALRWRGTLDQRQVADILSRYGL
jgi:ATP-dependent Zn protease